ncbi:MAG: tetratricopeptide repeat protein, partial [bacterium]
MDSFKLNGSLIIYCKVSLFASFLVFSIYPALVESQSNPQIFNLLVQKADSLLHIGKYKEAEIAYQQALVFNKRSTNVFKGLGEIAYARENWTEFHKCFQKVLKIDPNDAEAKEYLTHKSKVWLIVVKADSLRTLGDLKQAEKAYKKALNLDDEYIEALKGLGRIAYEKGDWKNLQKWIKKALKFDPEDAEAMDLLNNNPQIRSILLRADSLSRVGNLKAADKAYKQLLKINRESIVALKWFGQRAFVKKDWGGVKNWYNKVLKAQPLDLEANYWLGVAYRETGKFKSLILKSKDFNKAKKYFDVIIRRDSTYSDVFYQRALLEKLNEHWIAAIKLAQRQIRLKPNLIHATVGLFKLYRLFLVHESDAEVENWLKNNKGEWSTYILTEHYRRTKNFIKAESTFQELLQKNLTMSKEPIYLSMIRMYLQQDNQNEANKYFQMALDSMTTNLDVEFMFEDSKYIFTDKEFGFLRNLSTVDQEKTFFQRFWTYRNPIPSYSINVRAMEHFKRLLYAE